MRQKTLKVRTGGADLRLKAHKPGSAMGDEGQPSCAFAHPSCLPSQDFSRYIFRAGSTLVELTVTPLIPVPNQIIGYTRIQTLALPDKGS